MNKKKSFIIHIDNFKQWDMLDDVQAGKLIKALFRYAKSGETPEFSDGMTMMAFSFISEQLNRDMEKFQETCQKRSDAARKRWANSANASFAEVRAANNADNENENENESENESENENENESENESENDARLTNTLTAPTVSEVKEYCAENGLQVDAERFVDYYSANGWIMGRGNQIRDWKAVVRMWARQERQQNPPSKEILGYDPEELAKAFGVKI